MKYNVVCWWSGGVTSAVACKIAIDLYGLSNCHFIMMDTKNEDDDTYRFKLDCEKWYGKEIQMITAFNKKNKTIQDVWYNSQSLNVAHGAICSSTLKRDLRLQWQKENEYKYQIFGFDFSKREFNRALSTNLNYKEAKAIYPLLMMAYDKEKCLEIVKDAGIKIPDAYLYGFNNNNCLKTGCVQGGIGYWQKMFRDFPEKYDAMAKVEHDLTDLRGYPVTMCKHQSKEAKNKPEKEHLLFLKKHHAHPNNLTVLDIEAIEPKPLLDCNGIGCAVNDLIPQNKTQFEINYDQ